MTSSLDGLTPAQRAAVTHPGPALVLAGAAGTGKTHVLLERVGWLVAEGARPESILLLAHSEGLAAALRARLEEKLQGGYEELAVHTMASLCLRLLRDEAPASGLDPFVEPATPAVRLALLLEHIDELPMRHHDFGGRPAALLASFVTRIDRLKEQLVDAEGYARWAEALTVDAGPAAAGRRRVEVEFASLYAHHDRLLREQGTPDEGDLLLLAHRFLVAHEHVRARLRARFPHLLVDDHHDLGLAAREIIALMAAGTAGSSVVLARDGASSLAAVRGAPGPSHPETPLPGAQEIRLEESRRSPAAIVAAATAVLGATPSAPAPAHAPGAGAGEVRMWRAANERAQAQAVAGDLEALLRSGVPAGRVAVLVRSVANEAQPLAVAFEERAIPYRLHGTGAFFERTEVRDVLAWLRLLVDPRDSAAVVRALSRPPVELRSIDLARCVQISRRRKLDMVGALVAATESPQIPPESRERILAFLRLHRSAAAALDTTRPDLFVHRLVERLGLRRQQLFTAQADVVARLLALARLGELATAYARRVGQATPREFARYLAAVAESGLPEPDVAEEARPGAVSVMSMEDARGLEFDHVYVLGLHAARMPGARPQAIDPIPAELLGPGAEPATREAHVAAMRRLVHVALSRARRRLVLAYPAASERGAQPPSPFAEDVRAALGVDWEDRGEELFGPAESLHSRYRIMRDEVLEGVPTIGSRLTELRLDTDLDISHGAVRYLELLKLGALLARPAGQGIGDALPDINTRLLAAATSMQREIFLTSSLDEVLLDAERAERKRAQSVAARAEPSLEPFLPRRGEGLVLSASDIETYRTCPLKYKFARVFRIPQEPTLHQRFGILVHQVLERFHHLDPGTPADLHGLLEAGWRRGGFGDSEEERQLHAKASAALSAYHERYRTEPGEPMWFERAFSFRLGPHHLRGRVDRVDRLPDGAYELIDYKTGRPKTASQLREDIQLSLYAVGAREAWNLDAAQQSYYYVLDDEKVAVPRTDSDRAWIEDTVLEVGEGILAQGFEPTPSFAACSMCDYRIACPAAER